MKYIVSLAMILLLLLPAGCSESAAVRQTASVESTGRALPREPALKGTALGETVYAEHCANCHGQNLEGEANWKLLNDDGSFRSPPHTADGHTWHHADSVLIAAIKEGGARFEGMNIGGSSNMPAFAETLTDEEILAVLAFIKSTWPEDVRAMQWQQTAQDISP